MISKEEYNFLKEIKNYGVVGVEEFLYLFCTNAELGSNYLKTFLNENVCLNAIDKFVEKLQNVNIGEDGKISIEEELKKFFSLFPLSMDTSYASTSLLYFLMTSNNSKIREAFSQSFQSFFVEQGFEREDARKLYLKFKNQLEDETALGNLVKDAKERANTTSPNRDKNIARALSMRQQGAVDKIAANDAQQAFLQKLKEARENLTTAPQIANVLKSKVLSQDTVCDKMGEVLFSLVNNFSFLDNSKTPIARLLFCGPSGSGKTLLSQTIAEKFFDTEALLIQCSQYQDRISANRLFGSSPGYVGYDDDTPLQTYLRDIKKQGKKGVIIFDEIEKMHSSVLNSLLSALDGNDFQMHSKDNGNEKFNLRNCLIVGTSNLASDELGKEISRLGFQTPTSQTRTEKDNFALIKNAAQKTGISTEFFNRFEHVFSFKKLTEEDYKKIAKKHCEDTLKIIKETLPTLKVKIDDTALKLMSKLAKEKGDNTRVIEDMATKSLDHVISVYLLTHKGSENSSLVIGADGDKLCVTKETEDQSPQRKVAYGNA